MKPELVEHVSDSPNKKRAITINIIFYLLLILLTSSSYFWELWRSGSLRIPFNPIILAVILLSGILTLVNIRFSGWHPRWVWFLWLAMIIAMPFLTVALDTTLARVIQLETLIVLTIIFFSFPVIQTAQNKMLVVVGFFSIVLLWLLPYVFMNQQRLIGPCNMLSTYRMQGCERSLQFENTNPFNNVELISTDESNLMYLYGSTVWVEPINRWEALIQGRPYYFEENVHFVTSRMRGQLMDVYKFGYLHGNLLGSYYSQIYTSAITRVDLETEEQIGQTRIEYETETELIQAYEAMLAAEKEMDSEIKTNANAISDNHQWKAISFENNRVQVWHNPEVDEVNELPDLNFSVNNIQSFDNEPYWSFESDMPFRCLSFSTDGTLLAAHAGYGYDMLHIYDVVDKVLITAVSIEATTPCPQFSYDNTYLAVVNDLEQDSIYLLSSFTGEIVATVSLERFDYVQDLSFSPSNDYLAATIQFNERARRGAGLLFNLETVLNN